MRLERVTLVEDGVTLLDTVSLHVFKGEIMGLLCVNAHGQDALVKLLCQNLPIHYGYVYLQDLLVNNYKHSNLGLNRISVIEERSRLVEGLTVADNIFVLRRGFKKMVINPRVLGNQLKGYMAELDIPISPGDYVASLSFFERCVVELVKAVVTGVKLVVIRDISNFISAEHLVKFHQLLRHYTAQGITFLYICNHHQEAFTICHRTAIMENGRILRILNKQDFKDENIDPYTLDFGRKSIGHSKAGDNGALSFHHITTQQIQDLSFTAAPGECVVLLDMNNTIFPDIIRMVNGEMVPLQGKILLGGKSFPKRKNSVARDVAIIRDNPTHTMLFPELSYLDNLCFLLDQKLRFHWRRKGIKRSVVQEYAPVIGRAVIHSNDISSLPPLALYDLIYHRVHLLHPKVVFCLQPFSGADMYLRHHLISLINKLRKKNIAVVILAVNISDSLSVADRLLIIRQGRLQEEYHSNQFHSRPFTNFIGE